VPEKGLLGGVGKGELARKKGGWRGGGGEGVYLGIFKKKII